MILEALKVIATELNNHLNSIESKTDDKVVIGNIAFESDTNYKPNNNDTIDNKIVLSLIKVEEEKSLKNGRTYTKNMVTLESEHHNRPVFVNLYVIFSVNSHVYENALTYLSRIIRFFQYKNVFTHNNSVTPTNSNPHDHLEKFKLLLDLWSPGMEEVNHMWSILGGRHLPFAMYRMRLLELEYRNPEEFRKLIEEVTITPVNI